jgi:hypothetical protein
MSQRMHFQSWDELSMYLPSRDQLSTNFQPQYSNVCGLALDAWRVPQGLDLLAMSSQFPGDSICLNVKDNDSPVDLAHRVYEYYILCGMSGDGRRDLTLPEARKSPFRLNLKHVACPLPKSGGEMIVSFKFK